MINFNSNTKLSTKTKKGIEELEEKLNSGKWFKRLLTLAIFKDFFTLKPSASNLLGMLMTDWNATVNQLSDADKVVLIAARKHCEMYMLEFLNDTGGNDFKFWEKLHDDFSKKIH